VMPYEKARGCPAPRCTGLQADGLTALCRELPLECKAG